jgi:hypothetical protein
MSTSFDIRCTSCQRKYTWKCETGIDEMRSPDDLWRIIEICDPLARVGELLKLGTVYFSGIDDGPLPAFAKFFASHVGHTFSVYDEYGSEWPLVQAYNEKGEKLGEPRAHRLEMTKPGHSTAVRMPK